MSEPATDAEVQGIKAFAERQQASGKVLAMSPEYDNYLSLIARIERDRELLREALPWLRDREAYLRQVTSDRDRHSELDALCARIQEAIDE